MKRFLPLLIILLSFTVVAQTTNRAKHKERIKALKTAFITEKLELTPQEAQKFWPVYNEFDDKKAKIKFEDLRALKIKVRTNFETLSDKEATKMLDDIITAENKLHQLKTKFITDLKAILPAKKIMLLKAVEDEFNRKMLDEFKKRRQGRLKE